MVCSGFSLMDVHNLDNGEERQKDEAYYSNDRQST